ncbi:MAG: TerB family tellurite resistance protein [Polyangiaceae bacterium]|nr:TerB family tellurite resistance protein [Polyangiaceae bacterium]
MKIRTTTIQRLRDALLKSGRRQSIVSSSAYRTLAREGLLSETEKNAITKVASIAEVMFLMMAADEMIVIEEMDAFRGAIRGLSGDVISDDLMQVLIEDFALRLKEEGRTARLRAVAEAIQDEHEVESAFTLAAAVALADDQVEASEQTLLEELAQWFGLSPEQSQGLLSQLSSEQ